METIAGYFNSIPSTHRALILVGGITIFWLIENAFPLFRFRYHKFRHAGVNIVFTLTTVVVNFILAFALVLTSRWVVENKTGILQWLPGLPLWAEFLIGLILLDFVGAWLIHWIQHKVKWMWKFHLVHHTDTYVDTTTANRHHPGESVFRFAFTMLAVLVTGAPMWLVFAYQSISVLLSQFNHANIRLPASLDRILSLVIVTPNMHHVHHHYRQPYTDTNYGNIFSFWDRLFGTFATVDQHSLVYGVDTHMSKEENSRIGNLFKIPFQKYRTPSGKS
ncbi:sterol desaturase family protein [Ravibacter arvi]|uniref:Sterol desaturase family protein n=1 Tax=Ravibacter arvi TaxID=2051041 RepID=A0ABP8LMU6_9BACT